MSQVKDAPKVWVCDGCSSWTAKEVPRDELLSGWWGWVEGADGDGSYVYCPECA